MYNKLAPLMIITTMTTSAPTEPSIFTEDHVIFTTNFNISKVLVPADTSRQVKKDSSDGHLIFFTVDDHNAEGGSCIYVLEGFVAYEVLEGGRDSTADYSNDKSIYFGAIDGLYKFCAEHLSARKYGQFRDNIVQLQKANNTDAIYILTVEKLIYRIDNNGTVKTRISSIRCATEFVLDIRNNIYYVDCNTRYIHIVQSDGVKKIVPTGILEDFSSLKLLRPPYFMDDSIPFFVDGNLYFVSSSGTIQNKDFYINASPTALSIDAALYIVIAMNGKLYEYNLMEDLLSSMFNMDSKAGNTDISRLIISTIDNSQDGLYGLCKSCLAFLSN